MIVFEKLWQNFVQMHEFVKLHFRTFLILTMHDFVFLFRIKCISWMELSWAYVISSLFHINAPWLINKCISHGFTLWKMIFNREMDLMKWIPSWWRKTFFLMNTCKNLISHVYLDSCKNEAWFNLLSFLTSFKVSSQWLSSFMQNVNDK